MKIADLNSITIARRPSTFHSDLATSGVKGRRGSSEGIEVGVEVGRLSVPLQHQSVNLQIGFLVREHGKEVDHREPPGKDDKGLESGDGDAEQLELLREVEDGEEDGAEEGDLQEAEHDQPREQEVAHSPGGPDEEDDRGKQKDELDGPGNQDVPM